MPNKRKSRPARFKNHNYYEIRKNPDGTLDEVCAGYVVDPKTHHKQKGVFFHLERMDHNFWWMCVDLPNGKRIHVNLSSRGKIKATTLEE